MKTLDQKEIFIIMFRWRQVVMLDVSRRKKIGIRTSTAESFAFSPFQPDTAS